MTVCLLVYFLSVGSMSTLLDPLEDLPPGIAQYEDYHTIDWQREIARDRMRHRFIVGRWRAGQCFEKLKSAHDAWSGWICVLLVGCVAGEVLLVTYTCSCTYGRVLNLYCMNYFTILASKCTRPGGWFMQYHRGLRDCQTQLKD